MTSATIVVRAARMRSLATTDLLVLVHVVLFHRLAGVCPAGVFARQHALHQVALGLGAVLERLVLGPVELAIVLVELGAVSLALAHLDPDLAEPQHALDLELDLLGRKLLGGELALAALGALV